ncbi:HAD-like domain protein [Metarhizium album ARSEF 1941]|uniref:HAD-like domain protein n=1 Tax=Metarhizium album (strain ARSEF 1941) TaxID=1081103 RepID=A0A0B2WQR0_METAS|nr:HAD-like domain protein [Metarhizium album ARSEF 1941]KHN95300.1 HAD-like domain protein [Metarhizium album ARSEF 1941]
MRLVLDFDGTVTQKDTIGELARAAIDLQRHRTGRHLQAAWDDAVQAYLRDCESYRASFDPPEASRKDAAAEARFLAGLKDAEEASLSRVSQTGIFAGLQRDDFFQMGVDAVLSGRVAETEGFQELMRSAERKGLKVDVVSVNWSRAFIQGVLHPRRLDVAANDVSENGDIKGPQTSGGTRITTSRDKLDALRRVTQADGPVWYFGDSVTDLQCLLYSRGVVIAEDATSPLLRTLSRIGIDVPHVANPRNRENTKLFWARDFRQVLASRVLEQGQ